MVEIDRRTICTAIICLTIIELGMIINGNASEALSYAIIAVIAMSIGVFIPNPRMDNNRGVLIW